MPIFFHETIDPVPAPDKHTEYLSLLGDVVRNRTNAPGSTYNHCVANWATVWATGRWPEITGMWQMVDGWPTFAEQFSRAQIWEKDLNTFYDFRSGGFDRILVPASYCPTLDEMLARPIRAPLVRQEIVTLVPGKAQEYIDRLGDAGAAIGHKNGFQLIGSYLVAFRNNSEVLNLWAFENFLAYIRTETEPLADPELHKWRLESQELERSHLAKLMRPTDWSPLH